MTWKNEPVRHSLASQGFSTSTYGFNDEPKNLDEFLEKVSKFSSNNTFDRKEELKLAKKTSKDNRTSIKEVGFNIQKDGDELYHTDLIEGKNDKLLVPYEENMKGTFHTHPIGMPNPSLQDLRGYFDNDFDCAMIGCSIPSSYVLLYFEIPDDFPEEKIIQEFDYEKQEDKMIDEINLCSGEEKIDIPVYTEKYMNERFKECIKKLKKYFKNVQVRRFDYD